MPPKKKTKTSNEEEDKAVTFTWSDDELQLLLAVILHFKSDNAGQGYDWESVKTKYRDIRDIFIDRYPKDGNNEQFSHKDPNISFTKERLIAKVKALRTRFKVALDSGRTSGGGRVVAQFYDLCAKNWGGSPAAESFPGGIETSDTSSSTLTSDQSPATPTGDEADIETAGEWSETTSTPIGPDEEGLPKRSLIEHLEDSRNAKLRKPIPAEKQMLQIAKDDMTFKKQMLVEMKEVNKAHAAQMNMLTNSLVNLINALTTALNQPQYMPQQQMLQHRPQQIQFTSPVQGGAENFLGQMHPYLAPNRKRLKTLKSLMINKTM